MVSSATSPDLSEVRQVGIASQGSWSEGGTSPQETNLDTPETDLQAAGPGHDCYATILVRSAKLEQSLAAAPGLPPVDLLLGAERDVRALQERLFACTGHAPPASVDHGANNSANNNFANHIMRSCLWSGRPALLSLALLAERVVSMLEETLRSAARSSYESERTFRETPWLDAQVPAISARRLGRSFRSLMDRPFLQIPFPQRVLHVRWFLGKMLRMLLLDVLQHDPQLNDRMPQGFQADDGSFLIAHKLEIPEEYSRIGTVTIVMKRPASVAR
ncbi:hypothetical protein VPNG_01628 [Cytospora leucostoma]|uniref:Uncharacterized protein n=1 Tax=Cytospora leucostoma TaxID=1230097 RepID=A0A423XKB2_9PEZI|nr:hypothetical protein VPNG_01628 [Cytospora leucostoma]